MLEPAREDLFEQLRRRLFAVAYRMTGTSEDAEDIVQEAYLRWHKTNADEVRSPEAWLVSVVTRLSIDRLRKASLEREKYPGPWLPEPIVVSPAPSPEEELELASDLSVISFETDGHSILAVYNILNPEKLKGLTSATVTN